MVEVRPLTNELAEAFKVEAAIAFNGTGDCCSLEAWGVGCFSTELCMLRKSPMFIHMLMSSPIQYVAIKNGRYAGCVSANYVEQDYVKHIFSMYEFPCRAVVLYNLCVPSGDRGEGTGHLLVEEIKKHCPQGQTFLLIAVMRCTDDAKKDEHLIQRADKQRRFYTKCHFKKVAFKHPYELWQSVA